MSDGKTSGLTTAQIEKIVDANPQARALFQRKQQAEDQLAQIDAQVMQVVNDFKAKNIAKLSELLQNGGNVFDSIETNVEDVDAWYKWLDIGEKAISIVDPTGERDPKRVGGE